MASDVFDTKKIDEYAAQAKASWGNTPAYAEYEERSNGGKGTAAFTSAAIEIYCGR